MTATIGFQNQFFIDISSRFQIIEKGVFQCCNVTIKIKPHYDSFHCCDGVTLTSILSFDRKKGHASFVLSELCAILDRHGIDCYLVPSSFAGWHEDFENRLNDVQLEKWYQRYGWTPSPYTELGWIYIRTANNKGNTE